VQPFGLADASDGCDGDGIPDFEGDFLTHTENAEKAAAQ
jgi:hypothetical protein